VICAANSAASFSASLDESPDINIFIVSCDVYQYQKSMPLLML